MVSGNDPSPLDGAETSLSKDKGEPLVLDPEVYYSEGLETAAIETAIDELDTKDPTQKEALARYLRSGKRSDLERARQLYSGDRLIMMQSALAADRPDSPELARLEEADPTNAVPNFIRASLHAESGNLEGFKEEMKSALSKSKLDTGYRERWAMLFDAMIAEGIQELDPAIYTEFDSGVLDRMESTARALVNNPELFGDKYDTAGYAMAFANKVRAMGGGRHGFGLVAGQLEIDMLRRLDPMDEYGTDGLTIGERLDELNRRVPGLHQRVEGYFDPVMSSSGDPVLRMQFLARVRADGEVRALGWLINKMDAQ